jgi:hypothetical protein
MKKFILSTLITFVSFFLFSCKKRIEKLELIYKNPIEYIFDISKDSLYNKIHDFYFQGISSYTLENKNIISPEIRELLLKKDNQQDLYLRGISPLKSKVYRRNNKFLDYFVSFYLHLEKIDENHTRVMISTIKPEIVIGLELFPSPPNLTRSYKKISVEPSTIEEYEILLKIGKTIGQKDMPSLIMPDR